MYQRRKWEYFKRVLERSQRKWTRRASRELGIPQLTVWRVLRRCLLFKTYLLKLVHALRPNDKRKRVEFCDRMLQNMEDDTFLPRLIFSDEATFHLSGKLNRHKGGLQNLQEALEHVRDSPKVNVFCALSQTKVYGPFFFCWKRGQWGNVSRDAAKLASSSSEWRFRRLHFPTGRSSTPLAPGCSTFSEWVSTSTMDRSRRERRPGASVLAREISWSHNPRLFLVGVRKRNSLCTLSTNKFGRPKQPYHMNLIFVVPCIMLNSEINPTRCNNCV